MNREDRDSSGLDRRSFMGAAIGAAAGVGAVAMGATVAAADLPAPPMTTAPVPLAQTNPRDARGNPAGPTRGQGLYRVQADIVDLEVEGKIPSDLSGGFYRVGPDFQYIPNPRTIPFDGEGHVSLFRIKDGKVHYKSRFVRNERYVLQEAAGHGLYGPYRNPYLDDPSVAGKGRTTSNTHIINHKGYILALKEDGPPAALDLNTLATLDGSYTFDGQLPSATFTAHPKIDSETGDMIAFGYEAKGLGTNDVSIFQITPQGKVVWNTWIKVPYVGMLHDFAVTQKHIVFYVIPLAYDEAQMKSGGIHWSWDGTKPTYFGVLRRGGDGKDLRWFKGPERSSTHVMGAFSDKDRIYVDVEMSAYNPFPFMPMRDGSKWDPVRGASRITRLSADLAKKSVKGYDMEVLYPDHLGALPRQDDRYNTVPYRIGFLPCPDPAPKDPSKRPSACWARFDHQTRKATVFNAGEGTVLAECVFVPKNKTAPEGVGYLMGVATRSNEGGRSDLLILDAEHVEDGPIAVARLPIRGVGQIHGWWVPEAAIPRVAIT